MGNMHKWLIGGICAIIIGIGSWAVDVPAAVRTIIGMTANCPGCSPPPLTPLVLCQAPEFCTRVMAPDWADTDNWYGSDGTNCRKSTDGADTWANCGANPSATAVYNQYAVTMNGTVLAGGNDGGGTVFRIRRSTDGAASWSTVYDSTPIDLLGVVNGRFRCAQTQNLCTFFGRDAANNVWSLTSTTDGATWVLDTTISAANIAQFFATIFANDGSVGYAFGGIGDGFSNYRSINWTGVEWTAASTFFTPTTTGGVCNFAIILNGAFRSICHDTTLGTTWTIRNANGGVEVASTTFPDVPAGQLAQTGLAISLVANSIYLLYPDATGRTGIWVSLDSGVSFTKLFATDPAGQGIGTQGSIYMVNSCLYASYIASATSTVLRVC